MKEKKCYTVPELQEILMISRPTVYELLRKNHFRSFKLGGKYLIPRKGFDEWMENGIPVK